MIDALDQVLRRLFTTRVPSITLPEQVRFRPPNDGWRSDVIAAGGDVLNVYLVDLRENRVLRSNDRLPETRNGITSTSPAPRRIDCHYLITAWSPTDVTPQLEPTLDEHRLLYQVTAALMDADPLLPERVYAPDPLPSDFPEALARVELPARVLPVDGFPKYAELWGTMGEDLPWKPAVYLIVTVPVLAPSVVNGPPVTTLVSEYRPRPGAEPGDILVQIGGTVRSRDGDDRLVPVPGAWVRLQTADPSAEALQTAWADADGRFTFAGLRAGRYQLRARAAGRGAPDGRPVEVPSDPGEYDLELPPLEPPDDAGRAG